MVFSGMTSSKAQNAHSAHPLYVSELTYEHGELTYAPERHPAGVYMASRPPSAALVVVLVATGWRGGEGGSKRLSGRLSGRYRGGAPYRPRPGAGQRERTRGPVRG
jgi:hypothetical protein